MGLNMLGDGLSASIWAPKHGEHYRPKPGDWDCTCGYSNFARRTVCNQCTAPRGSNDHLSSGYGSSVIPQRQSSGYQNGLNQVYPSSTPTQTSPDFTFGRNGGQNIHHGHPTALKSSHGNQSRSFQHADPPAIDLQDLQKYGLATSRWAPRNYRPGRQQSDEPEIWTRVREEDFYCWNLLTITRADGRQAQTTGKLYLSSRFEPPRPRPSLRSTTLYPRHDTKDTGGGLL